MPKTARLRDTSRQSIGFLFLKEKVINRRTYDLAYFTDYKTGKTYEILDKCDDGSDAGKACLKAVNDCKDGTVCKVNAEFTEGDHRSILAKKFEDVSGETKATTSGVKLTRVSPSELERSGVKDPIAFGEAWQLGKVIWGAPARDKNGAIRTMPQRARSNLASANFRKPKSCNLFSY